MTIKKYTTCLECKNEVEIQGENTNHYYCCGVCGFYQNLGRWNNGYTKTNN